MSSDEVKSLCNDVVIPIPPKEPNSAIWSGFDSRIMLFISQITFSFIAVIFGMYLIISNNGDGFLTIGSSLITFVLGFLTKNPVIGKRR